MEALRRALPADWTLRVEREPVFGGSVLTVLAGPADAPPLLLVHGLGENGFTDWLPVLPQLARSHRVLALDLPGFGYSDRPPGKYSPRNYARVLAHLLARHARAPALVVGHSMGAAVALRLAADHPQHVRKLVLINAAGILQRTAFVKHSLVPSATVAIPPVLREPAARARDWGVQAIERVFGLPHDPTRVLQASELAWALLLRDHANVNAALALIEEDFAAAVHTVRQPTHVIWGEADAVAPLRTGQVLARRLPNAQLVTLPGVGHTPMQSDPQPLLALLTLALQDDPVPAPVLAPATVPAPDLECVDLADRRYRGHYRTVHIERCRDVRLEDLTAERIVIRDSRVHMVNVRVDSPETALQIAGSELVATAVDLNGRIAIHADAARLDLAGVLLRAHEHALLAARRTRVIASVSRIESPPYTGFWHEDRELANATLSP
ncbi:MAG: alpha/beta hydrolase [Burkholderiaceae bacterium]|nr:alpha/beta hydrolase [Burkholderiaceae bacterium]